MKISLPIYGALLLNLFSPLYTLIWYMCRFINLARWRMTLRTKATIHQVTTMLATSKNVLFRGHNHHSNHRYWWPFTHWQSGDNQSVESSIPVVSRWLWPGNMAFLEVASMVVSWWAVDALPSDIVQGWMGKIMRALAESIYIPASYLDPRRTMFYWEPF